MFKADLSEDTANKTQRARPIGKVSNLTRALAICVFHGQRFPDQTVSDGNDLIQDEECEE